ncbi:MAG: TRAP transporter small permease [Pseudomonadota bacterium]
MSELNDTTLSVPPEDGFGRLIWRLDRVLRWPEDFMNLAAATATLFLVLIGVYQIVVGMRDLCAFWDDELCISLINAPMFGYIDMIELAMPILAIIGIAYCMRVGTHIRMDILIGSLKGRVLWSIETFVALVTLVLAVMLMYFSYNFFNDAFTLGDSTTDAEIATWPSKLLVPIAFAVLSLRLFIQFLGALRLTIRPSLRPVGVVVQKDIAEQAQEEIREAMGSEGSR